MPSIAALTSRAWESSRLGLAVVPFVAALARVDAIRRLLDAPRGFSVTVSFPHPVTTVWTFVNVPAEGGGVDVALPSLVLLPAGAAVVAVLASGYLGRIDAGLGGPERSFADGVRAFALPLFGYRLLQVALVALFLPLVLAGPAALVVVLPALLVVSYLLFATPFLVVAEGRGLVDALSRSYGLAVGGGAHLSYGLQYALVVLMLSVPASLLVRNGGLPGIVLGAAAVAPVGLALDGATMLYVRERVREGAGDDGTRGGGDTPDGDVPRPAVRRVDPED